MDRTKRRKIEKEASLLNERNNLLESDFANCYRAFQHQLKLDQQIWRGPEDELNRLKSTIYPVVFWVDGSEKLHAYSFTQRKISLAKNLIPLFSVDLNKDTYSALKAPLKIWSKLWEDNRRLKKIIKYTSYVTVKGSELILSFGISILDSFLAPQDAILSSGSSSSYTALLDYTFLPSEDEEYSCLDINTALFYDCARKLAKSLRFANVSRDPRLSSELLPFQMRVLEWMKRREEEKFLTSNDLPPLWYHCKSLFDDRMVYVNHVYGYMTFSKEKTYLLASGDIRGGILADEMGMGKTLEVLGLVLHHQLPISLTDTCTFDQVVGKNVKYSKATLIITPSTILDQWLSEIDLHVPSLKVFHYQGIRKSNGLKSAKIFLDCDIVVTSYSDLRFELLYTESHSRTLRHEKRHVSPKSPLIDVCWWRICVDEAQMVETSQSNVAQMIYRIPRVNCWTVSGTPVRSEVDDLFGLLFLLRYSPMYLYKKQAWMQIIEKKRVREFCDLFGSLVCRHSKQDVEEELKLPPQHRICMTTRLSVVEETNYQDLLSEAAKSLHFFKDRNLDLCDEESMRRWLVRLRQACCHPQVGFGNKSAFGGGPMKSINDVLVFMLEQTNSTFSSLNRKLYSDKIIVGQIYDHIKDYNKALAIWSEVRIPVELAVKELENVIYNSKYEDHGKNLPINYFGLDHFIHLRVWYVLLHKIYFFIASAYFSLKNEKFENEFYLLAQDLRRKIMSDVIIKTSKHLEEFSEKFIPKKLVKIPRLQKSYAKGLITGHGIIEDYNRLYKELNDQKEVLIKFRDRLIHLMKLPLLDQESDPTGDEYEESLNAQSEISYCIDVYRQMLSDRVAAVSGTINTFVSHETELEKYKLIESIKKSEKSLDKQAEERDKKYLLYFEEREEARPKADQYGSLINIVSRLLDASNRSTSSFETSKNMEEYERIDAMAKEQSRICQKLEKELSIIQLTYNSRIEYYKQLQEISDSLMPPPVSNISLNNYVKDDEKKQKFLNSVIIKASVILEKEISEKQDEASQTTNVAELVNQKISEMNIPGHIHLLRELEEEKSNTQRKIAHFESRRRYLTNLYEHIVLKAESHQICIICRDIIKQGFITTCGKYLLDRLSS